MKHKQQESNIMKWCYYAVTPRSVFRSVCNSIDGKRCHTMSKFSFTNLEKKEKTVAVSEQSGRKIKNAINWLVAAAVPKRVYVKESGKNYWFKVNFITLTIPKKEIDNASYIYHNAFKRKKIINEVKVPFSFEEIEALFNKEFDAKCKQMLNNFITTAKNKWNLKNYFWKAETTKEGIIHFHLTTDTFLHHKSLRLTWNRILTNNGLTDEFYQAHHHRQPPSTEVKAVIKVNNIAGYLLKYLSKSQGDRRIVSGRSWGCNYELSYDNRPKVDCPLAVSSNYDNQLFSKGMNFLNIYFPVDSMGVSRVLGELFLMGENVWKSLTRGGIRKEYEDHLFSIRYQLQQLFFEVDTFAVS